MLKEELVRRAREFCDVGYITKSMRRELHKCPLTENTFKPFDKSVNGFVFVAFLCCKVDKRDDCNNVFHSRSCFDLKLPFSNINFDVIGKGS